MLKCTKIRTITELSGAKSLMSREILDKYCTLLVTDKPACMQLFAEDAQLITHGESRALCLRGKDEILDYFVFIPNDLSFKVLKMSQEGDDFFADVSISGVQLPEVRKRWKCRFREDKIVLLEVLG